MRRKGDSETNIIFFIFAIIMVGIALVILITFIPGFTLSACWMSTESQAKQFALYELQGPLKKDSIDFTFSMGKCVDKAVISRKPLDCTFQGTNPNPSDSDIDNDCPFGYESYFLVCRERSSSYNLFDETWWKTGKDVCIGLNKKISDSSEKEMSGPGKSKKVSYCIKASNIKSDKPFRIKVDDGECPE